MARNSSVLSGIAALVVAGSAPAADCNLNGSDDATDIVSGASADCNANGVPDECDIARRWEPGERVFLGASCVFFMAWPRDTAIVSADLDGDGKPDLATANCSSNSVSVFPSWGNRIYGQESLLPAGDTPVDLSQADVDGDGDLDLVTANYGSNDASVLLNLGNGTFETFRSYSGGTSFTTAVAPGDYDGDGRVDLALSGSPSIAMLYNSGGGAFAPGAPIPTRTGGGQPFYPKNLESADLDGDGDPDLIAGDHEVYLWRNGGGRTFAGLSAYPMTGGNRGFCWTHTILTVDVTGDGRPDIVTADYTDGGTPSVSVLRNGGNFAFTGPETYFFDFRDECQYVTAADLDGDGDTDLAAVGGEVVGLLTNTAGGTFADPKYLQVGAGTSVILADDIDLDGDPDLLVKRWVDPSRWIEVLGNTATSLDGDGNGIPDECEPSVYLVGLHEPWSFFRGRTAPPAGWKEPAFDDSGWERGRTGIGYGDGDDLTVLDDMRESYMAVFCRKVFDVADPATVGSLMFQVDCDDGFVAYLNGLEVARSNMPDPPVAFDAPALTAKEPGKVETFDISAAIGSLLKGRNVLAVEVHNVSLGSSDLSFIPGLRADIVPPPVPALAVSSSSIEQGSTGAVQVLLTSVELVQGFSFGIAHDPAVASLEAIDIGGCPAMEALNGGSGPEFFDFDIDAGTGQCGPGMTAGGTVYAVASAMDPGKAIPACSDLPVVRFLYRAAPGATPGMTSSLEIVGCLGDFRPWKAVLTIGDSSWAPRTSNGTLTIVERRKFLRGDTNGDTERDISDAVTILRFLFSSHDLSCIAASDANDDGWIDISDAVKLLFYLFCAPDPLPEPCWVCGVDPTDDGLSCARYTACGE